MLPLVHPNDHERACLQGLLSLAKAEDLGPGDVTAAVLPAGARLTARFVAREALTVCGVTLLEAIAAAYDPAIRTECLVEDGSPAEPGDVLARWSGPAGPILAAERVALNFLQHLSGVATLTRTYVDAVEGTAAAIYDTRKTLPAFRALDKYAVRCGGGRNHRMGLFDAVLVKDNHLAALQLAGSADPLADLADPLERIADRLPEGGFVEVEVDTLDEFTTALSLPVDVILLDNFTTADLTEAVARRDGAGLAGRIALEASGGVTFQTVRAIAATGVDRIAVGATTHSAPAVDVALDVEAAG